MNDFLPETKEGSNSYTKAFLLVLTKLVMPNYPSFTVHDVQNCCKSLDIPPQEIKRLFGLWSEQMVSQGKLKKVNGVYDDCLFLAV